MFHAEIVEIRLPNEPLYHDGSRLANDPKEVPPISVMCQKSIRFGCHSGLDPEPSLFNPTEVGLDTPYLIPIGNDGSRNNAKKC